jgi:hypothetical protein
MELTPILAAEYISLLDICTIGPRYDTDLDWANQQIKDGRQLNEVAR